MRLPTYQENLGFIFQHNPEHSGKMVTAALIDPSFRRPIGQSGSSRLSVDRVGKALRFGFSHGGQFEMPNGEGEGGGPGSKEFSRKAKGSGMNRPNTRANQSCRSPYSACLHREADLELQAREPNTVRPDVQRAAYSALGSPFAIFATFAREIRFPLASNVGVPPSAPLRPRGKIPLPSSPPSSVGNSDSFGFIHSNRP